MADIIDRAQAYEVGAISAAIAEHRRRISATGSREQTHCQSCGEKIPAVRRRAVSGCRYCIECQTEMER